MAKIMNMPKIGVNMTDGKITEWLVKEGDRIAEGDAILSAETDKAVQEIYSNESGRIAKFLVQEGETAVCQEPLAILAEENEDISGLLAEVGGPAPSSAPAAPPARSAASPVSVAGNGHGEGRGRGRIRISPLARKMAEDRGIDIGVLTPAEPGARIVKEDVLRFAGEPSGPGSASPPGGAISGTQDRQPKRVPHSGIRRVIAERMQQSNVEIPRAVLNIPIEAEELLAWKESYARRGQKTSLNSLIIKALGRALADNPAMNARWTPEAVEILPSIHVGIAVDTERGLLVPVIRDVDRKGVREIDRELKDKAERARSGSARSEELSGSTFTVTNLGNLGIESFTPVVNPGECAILAIGAVEVRPVWNPAIEEFEPVQAFTASLAFDHRIVDGAPAGRFLARLKELMEEPLGILD